MKRALILHGWKGRGDASWLGWLGEELRQRGLELIVPQFPPTESPDATGWRAEIERLINEPDDELVLVGHSMGCWVILNYLNKVKYEGQVAGVVLVAGGGSENLDYTRLKKIIRRRFVIHSDNDPIVEPERSRRLAKDLDAEEIELPGLGHFNDLDEGVPEILQAVLDCYQAKA